VSQTVKGIKTTIKLQDIRLTIEQQQMVVDNLKLVDFVANKNRGYLNLDGLEYEDLQAIGRVGLIRAVARFDPTQSVLFSNLAIPFIKGEITHYIRDDKTSTIKTQRDTEPIKVVSLDRAAKDCETDCCLGDIIPDSKEYYQQPTIDDDLLRAIETLNREDRDILVMTQVNGCDRKTTAEWLETYPRHITCRIKFAVDRVREILAEPNIKLAKPKRSRNALPFVVDGVVNYPRSKYRCVVCNSIYGTNTTRDKNQLAQTCSAPCATSLGVSKNSNRYPVWTKQELEFCDNLVGKRNLEDIYEDLLAYNQAHNLPLRSKVSVKTKLTKSYKSIVVIHGDLSMRELARQLDILVDRIRIWEKNGLKSVKTSNGRHKITRDDLTQFARTDHYRFYDIDR
jgi:RNA polymerase sigma factor (sigma-70 family)